MAGKQVVGVCRAGVAFGVLGLACGQPADPPALDSIGGAGASQGGSSGGGGSHYGGGPAVGVGGCTAIGCTPDLAYRDSLPADASYPDIQSYTFEACWNDVCWTGQHYASVPADAYPLLAKPPEGHFPAEAPDVYFDLFQDEVTQAFTLSTRWITIYSGTYADGDILRSTVRNQEGFLVEHRAVVDYVFNNPNPGCGLFGGCWRPVPR
jgi:hypothetical protein